MGDLLVLAGLMLAGLMLAGEALEQHHSPSDETKEH
jgi:hypothetical protein